MLCETRRGILQEARERAHELRQRAKEEKRTCRIGHDLCSSQKNTTGFVYAAHATITILACALSFMEAVRNRKAREILFYKENDNSIVRD